MYYKGYKKKWDLWIAGKKIRKNKFGYMQILDDNTKKWVTVDAESLTGIVEESDIKR